VLDPLRQTFWQAMEPGWPKNAVVEQGPTGNLLIWYPMPSEDRPNRRSCEVVVAFDQRAIAAMAASEPHERGTLAGTAARSIAHAMARYDPSDESGDPFRVLVDEASIGR